MPDTSSDIRSRLQETQTLIQQGQRNEAIALLNKTINTPLTLAPDLFWAGLLAHDLQIPQAAAYLINEAIKLDPKVPDYHTHYGRVLTALQQYTLAEEALKKAIQMDPTPAMYYYHLGALYYASGDFQNAKTALRHTLNRDQQHIDTWASLARIALLESDYTAMRQHLQNALAFAPRHPQLLYLWGLLLKQ